VRYYRRKWGESRGDKYDHWGPASYFFETDDDGSVVRQVEVYEGGQILRYNQKHAADAYGMLSDQPIDIKQFQPFETGKEEFERAWSPGSEAGPVGT
jgi:hypothetical protein